MALTPAQQTTLVAMISQEGGLKPFTDEVQALYIASTVAASIITLTPAISVTISDLPAVNAAVAAGTSAAIYSIMAAIAVEAGIPNSTKLGPLMVLLYAAEKRNLGI